jgi:PadR family transcriptional regulator, regulatory protein PadR
MLVASMPARMRANLPLGHLRASGCLRDLRDGPAAAESATLDRIRPPSHFCCRKPEKTTRQHTGAAALPPTPQTDALRGTLDLLVLKTLTLQPMHGWGIGQRIGELSAGALDVNQGSLYPALQRLEHAGLVESEWGVSENNRRARFYRLTAAGRGALGVETENWRRFSAAIEEVLGRA